MVGILLYGIIYLWFCINYISLKENPIDIFFIFSINGDYNTTIKATYTNVIPLQIFKSDFDAMFVLILS